MGVAELGLSGGGAGSVFVSDRRIETTVVTRALMMAVILRKPELGLPHYSDRVSQYACKVYRKLLDKDRMDCSMGRKGNYKDNALKERFFGSLKREWLTGNYPIREAAHLSGRWNAY